MSAVIETRLLETLFVESPEFARLYRQWQGNAAQGHDRMPRVIVCGLLKAGKSSLLNALTGNLEHEYFETKASRATTSVAELAFEGLVYVDTPGLDANEVDDEEAWRGIQNADQLIFAHTLRVAALDTKEVSFLTELMRRHPEAAKRLVVTLTYAESADEDGAALTGLRHSFQSVLGHCPILIATSYTRHRKGMLENKSALVERSGIKELKQHLQALHIDDSRRQSMRSESVHHGRQQLEAFLAQMIQAREMRLQLLQRRRSDAVTRLHVDLAAITSNVGDRLTHYNNI